MSNPTDIAAMEAMMKHTIATALHPNRGDRDRAVERLEDMAGLNPHGAGLFENIVAKAAMDRARRHEAILRDLLGQWVSELDPELAVDHRTGQIIGLTFEGSGNHGGRPPIVVQNPAYQPALRWQK